MPKMVCGHCEVELKPERNGIWVVEMTDFGPYKIWAADLYQCPMCGHQTIAGFANEPTEHYEKGFQDLLKHVLEQKEVPVFYDFENMKQKKMVRMEQYANQTPPQQ